MSGHIQGLPPRPNASAGPSRPRPPAQSHQQAGSTTHTQNGKPTRHGSYDPPRHTGQAQLPFQQPQQHQQAYQYPQAYFQPNGLPPTPAFSYPQANLSGGYQAAYSNASAYGVAGAGAGAGPAATSNGYGYNQSQAYGLPQMPIHMGMGMAMGMGMVTPQMGMQTPSFGRSIFHQPTATPEGYSYSPAFFQPISNPSVTPGSNPHQKEGPPAKRPRNSMDTAVSTLKGVQAWRNCSHPGCKFVGPGEDVEVHEGDRHLIFKNGPKVELSEEEERFKKNHKGPPPPVYGTTITLQTEEDIAKWVAQRKAKFPSRQRVAEKEQDRQAAISRGEIPARRGRGGGMVNKRSDPASLAEDWGRNRQANAQAGHRAKDQGERTTGNARRGRGGSAIGRTGRGEMATDPTMIGTEDDTTVTRTAEALIGGAEEAEGLPNTEESVRAPQTQVQPAEPVVGETAKASPPSLVIPGPAEPVQTHKRDVRLCRHFARTGKCSQGSNCKFSHAKGPVGGQAKQGDVQRSIRDTPAPPPKKSVNAFERPSMLGALLANPIHNTLSQLSQTIRFLVENDMLKGVELYPGEAEEREKKRNAVTVVEEDPEEVKVVSEEAPAL